MKNKIITILISVGLFTNCGKEFLDRQPLSQLTIDKFYKSENDAFKAVLAVYSVFQGPRFYGESWPYVTELSSDDATHKDQPDNIDNFVWTPNANTGSDVRFAHIWALCFEGVYRANLVLDNVPGISMDEDKKKIILAEAKFLRAVFYWHLAVSYGSVPIFTTTVKDVNDIYSVRQSSRNQVYELIESDLKEAETALPDQWDSGNLGRATKWAAKSMLGKAYLYQQKWALAAEKLDEVINSGRFMLLPDFEKVFSVDNENNAESIFEIQYAEFGTNGFFTDGGVAGEGTKRDLIFGIQNQRGQQGFGEIIAVQDWVNNAEVLIDSVNGGVPIEVFNGVFRLDPRVRLSVWFPLDSCLTGYADDQSSKVSCFVYRPAYATQIKTGGNIAGEFYHVRKAINGYIGLFSSISPNNWRMIRYSDVLLMAAEAHNESGNLGKGIEYLNQVRSRARNLISSPSSVSGVSGVNNFPYTLKTINSLNDPDLERVFDASQEGLRAAIVYERRIELAFEYHRFLDMKRWEEISPSHPGAATQVFSQKLIANDRKNYNAAVHSRFPIPQFEIDLSKGALVQNPGY